MYLHCWVQALAELQDADKALFYVEVPLLRAAVALGGAGSLTWGS